MDSSINSASQTAGGIVLFTDTFNGLSLVDDADLEHISVRTKLVDPEVPDGVGHSGFDLMHNVALSGNVASVAVTPACIGWCTGGSNELRLYDISNRSSVSRLATLAGPLSPEALLADGNYLYVAGSNGLAFNNQFAVIDISNPRAPQKLGTVDIDGAGPMVKVGNRVLVSQVSNFFPSPWHNIQAIDISNPSAPTLLGPPNSATSANIRFSPIVVSGNVAYVGDSRLYVVDITDILSPSLVTTITLPDTLYAMASYGNHLYVACGTGGVRVYDITDPKDPSLVKTIATATSIRFVSVTSGRGVYVTDGVTNSSVGPQLNVFYVDE